MKNTQLVVFRVWRSKWQINGAGSVIALFPHDIVSADGMCNSYEHIGQHGEADYAGCMARTRPATPQEYDALKKELEGLGYRLRIRRRASWKRYGITLPK